MAKETKEDNIVWIKSPITKLDHVMVEQDPRNGECKFCIGSGYFTNEYPLNYKKHKDFDMDKFERNMPKLMKALRFDDGESYWYPTTIRTKEAMVLPMGDSTKDWKWAYVKIVPLTKEEKEKSIDKSDSKLDIDNAEFFDRFLDASKKIRGVNLDELEQSL